MTIFYYFFIFSLKMIICVLYYLRNTFIIIALITIFIGLLPSLTEKRVRFYTCYLAYGYALIFEGFLAPIMMLRPRDIHNHVINSKIIKYLSKIVGIKWELRNGHILEVDRAAVVVANHQNLWDILGLIDFWHIIKKCSPVTKKEVLYILPTGITWWLCGSIFIDRSNPKAANAELDRISKDYFSKKIKLWMFPEGTRNGSLNGFLPFKKGAFRLAIENGVPIIPVVYSPYYFLDMKNKRFDKGRIIVSVLEPISTESLTENDMEDLKNKTYNLMLDEYEKLTQEVMGYTN